MTVKDLNKTSAKSGQTRFALAVLATDLENYVKQIDGWRNYADQWLDPKVSGRRRSSSSSGASAGTKMRTPETQRRGAGQADYSPELHSSKRPARHEVQFKFQ